MTTRFANDESIESHGWYLLMIGEILDYGSDIHGVSLVGVLRVVQERSCV